MSRAASQIQNHTNRQQTLVDVMLAHQDGKPIFFDEGIHGPAKELSREALWSQARTVASELSKRGVRRGDCVMLLVSTRPELMACLFGVWQIGAMVSISAPFRPLGRATLFQEELMTKLNLIRPKLVITQNAQSDEVIKSALDQTAVSYADIFEFTTSQPIEPKQSQASGGPFAEDIAILQFTSGSTSQPKATKIYHYQLIENINAIHQQLSTEASDRMVSWFPLYHDMGLVGACLAALHANIPLRLIPTETFAKDPSLWLKAVSDFKATASMAPPFALSILAKRIPDFKLRDVNLETLRYIITGSEPIFKEELDVFETRFKSFGLKDGVVIPAYGMSEATLAVTLGKPGQKYKSKTIDIALFQEKGIARLATSETQLTGTLLCVGTLLNNMQVRILNDSGQMLPESQEGAVQIRGSAVTRGYWGQPEVDRETEWFDTGDLGLLIDKELYITGRTKDLMKRGGVGYHPSGFEKAAEVVKGVRTGRVISFAYQNNEKRKELFVVVAEIKKWQLSSSEQLTAKIAESILQKIGVQVDEVVLVTAGSIPKTSSGKPQRGLCKKLYLDGRLRRAVRFKRLKNIFALMKRKLGGFYQRT